MAEIKPGLERISKLLKNVDFPWKSIHVAGTNGKGSICHHAASIVLGNSLKVGKFTSPHLVDRWDCITIDKKPVDEKKFRRVESHFSMVNQRDSINASPFEILTATAFTIFNEENVKVGIVEVGMGGKLDATNILNNHAVSVISKIARDHEDFLGNTLSEIAGHKAGILRPSVPYLVSSANERQVIHTIDDYAAQIGAGSKLHTDSFDLHNTLYNSSKWDRLTKTLAPFQQENMKMAAVAVLQTLDSMGKVLKTKDISKPLLANMNTHHHGRQERVQVPPVFRKPSERKNIILVDGAHNPDAAKALNEYVDYRMRYGLSPGKDRPESGWPVTWVLAMTEGKDAKAYLAKLLRPGDKVVTTAFGPVDGMPWVKPMHPATLLEVAKSVQPDITGVCVPVLGALRAVSAAKYLSNPLLNWAPIALTGSLYLVGDFHRELRPRSSKTWWTDTDEATVADRNSILQMQAEERERVNAVLRKTATESGAKSEAEKLQDEIDAVTREAQALEIEEERLGAPLSEVERFERDEQRFVEQHSTPEQVAAALARAEKAEAHLAAYAVRQQLEVEAREARAERRSRIKERAANRAVLKAERKEHKKAKEKQERIRREGFDSPPIITLGSRADRSEMQKNRSQEDMQQGRTQERRGTEHAPRTRPARDESLDALSVLSTRTDSFFGKSEPAIEPAKVGAPTDHTPSTSKPPRSAVDPPAAHNLYSQSDSPSDSRPSQRSQTTPRSPKIHMHYANQPGPGRSKIKEFPEQRRTRAWTTPRGSQHPGYKQPGQSRKSVVGYYAHEYGVRRGEGDGGV